MNSSNRHRLLVDASIAAFFVALDTGVTLVGGSWWPDDPGASAWVLLALQALACASLVARRRAPVAVLGVLAGYSLALTLLIAPAGLFDPAHGGTVWAPYATVLAAYAPVEACERALCAGSVGRTERRQRWLAVAAIVVLAVIVARPWHAPALIVAVGVLRTAIGPLVVLYLVARRRLVHALTERAERAEREQHLLAERARADERARLAGEMHDVVTHRLSLMVLQAGALRMTAADPATRQAAEELRVSGCRALEELRDLVGILRTSSDLASQEEFHPSLADLRSLVDECTAVGSPTELIEEGDPLLASPVVGRTAYRVVAEALTNVRKHAPGARVTVRLRYDDDSVRLTVGNTAATREPDAALAATGSGLGLEGLRRRIDLVDGTLRTGPTPDGGFTVDVWLPAYVRTPEPVG